MSWVRIPSEAAHFSKMITLGELCCVALSQSRVVMYMYLCTIPYESHVYVHVHTHVVNRNSLHPYPKMGCVREFL